MQVDNTATTTIVYNKKELTVLNRVYQIFMIESVQSFDEKYVKNKLKNKRSVMIALCKKLKQTL